MNKKKFFQYLFFTAIGIFFLYNFYKDFSHKEFTDTLRTAKLRWIALATLIHLCNHILRSWRWQILISIKGFPCKVWHTFLGEMAGFLTNLFIPRLGEWTRCTVMKKLDNVPTKESLSTVVTERFIDFVLFIFLSLIVFIIGLATKQRKVITLFEQRLSDIPTLLSTKGLLILCITCIIALILIQYAYQTYKAIIAIIYSFLTIVVESLRSTKEAKLSLTILTIIIWTSSFLVEYVSFFSLEATSKLGPFPALCIFLALVLGIASPIPGNVGTYHYLVFGTLQIFGVPESPATIYTTITHSIQTFNALFVGGIATIIASYLKKKEMATIIKSTG